MIRTHVTWSFPLFFSAKFWVLLFFPWSAGISESLGTRAFHHSSAHLHSKPSQASLLSSCSFCGDLSSGFLRRCSSWRGVKFLGLALSVCNCHTVLEHGGCMVSSPFPKRGVCQPSGCQQAKETEHVAFTYWLLLLLVLFFWDVFFLECIPRFSMEFL